MVIALYTSRVVLNTLGVVDYGVNNVVGSFIGLFSFLTNSLSSSMQRYYNFEGSKDGNIGFSNVLSAGIKIHLVVSLIVTFIFETAGIWYVNNVAVIPTGRIVAANFLFQVVVVSSVLSIMSSPFSGIILAKEHMNFAAFVGIGDVILRLLLVILLPYIPFDKLVAYSIITLLVTIVNVLSNVAYIKFKFPEIRIIWNHTGTLQNNILSFTGWNMAGTFAMMLKGQGINMLLNFFFGPIVNAARGIAYQVNTSLSNFYYNVAIAFRPQIVNSYASEDYERTKYLMFLESRICFALIMILITPMIIEMPYVLSIWLGNIVPEHTIAFASLILIETLVYTLHTPCSQVVLAVGRIRNFQIVNTVVNLGLLPTSWICLMLGYRAEMVFVINIVFAIINTIWCLCYTNTIFRFGLIPYFKRVILPCLALALCTPIVPYILTLIMPFGFIRLLVVFITSSFILIIGTYYILLNRNERSFLLNFLLKNSKKY